ncbi:hypothetical protein GBAR_LOCUS20640 [Geodia barretti]|uniref:Uncharacterized protein n=1 Tax=Geodia barretti TaxID=519541 RepID=A0AA35SY29_GEOBA|nr:hypothetical protein GBAR_LOCUS20640 [Geodia barretti]
MYGVVEEGVVYPGNMEVVVELNNGPIICSDLTDADTSCTVTLPRDIYNISITQSNDIGSTVDSAGFDMAVLVVAEQISLMLNTQLLFIVTVRRNGLCPETKSPVLVTFGTSREVAGGECEIEQKSSEMTISSGDSASFYGDAAPITLGPGETICFIVSLDGVPVISGTSSRNASTAITISGSSNESIVSVDAVAAATQDVSVVRIEPDPLQQLPCPQQMIEFRCQILVPSFAVQWTLPTGETLGFGGGMDIGAVDNSSDNAYSATLRNRMEDPNSAIRFFFTSTLLVLEPVNGSNLTCVGVTGAVPVKESTSIILSGTPDPPKYLSYNDRVVIESSVNLQWTRPSYTGGVAVMKYSVSVNGRRLEVADSSYSVSYTTSYLVYGDVMVSAINTCGQESQPAAINIPAAAPPLPNIAVQFTCESLPCTIEWTYDMEEGVVYPNMDFILNLTPTDKTASSHMLSSGDPACSDATSNSTYCTVTVSRDVYIISVNLTNDLGSTINSSTFDTRPVIVEKDLMLTTQLLLIVTVRKNALCPEIKSPVLVTFGTRALTGGECEIQQKATEMTISSGDSASFCVDAASITLGPDETIYFIISLDGVPFIYGTGNPSTAITTSCSSDENGFSVDAVAGLSVTLTLLVVLPVGVVFGCCGMWCLMKSRGRKKRRMAPPLYEEPVKPVFSLTENQAYGQVAHRQTTS